MRVRVLRLGNEDLEAELDAQQASLLDAVESAPAASPSEERSEKSKGGLLADVMQQGARDAQDTLEAVAPLTGSLQAILTAVQALDTRLTTIETKLDALAAAAGDPDAIANELAQRLAE